MQGGSPRRWPLSSPVLLLLVGVGVRAQQDCEVPAAQQELNSRPWFCEPPGIRSGGRDDLSECLGTGHRRNRTEPGLCRGRWQWYQVSTVHDHTVPYYDIVPLEDGSLQHERRTRVVADMRHALAVHMQTEFCPHTSDCGESQRPNPYYTTVDVLVVSSWNSN